MRGKIRRVFSTVLIALMIMPSAWIAFAEDTLDDNDDKTESATVTLESDSAAAEPAATPEVTHEVTPEITPEAASEAPETPAEEAQETSFAEPQEAASTEAEQTEDEIAEDAAAEQAESAEAPEPAKSAESVNSAEPAESAEPEAVITDEGTSSKRAASADAGSGQSITIGGTELDGSSDGSGKGWSYDKDSKVIILSDFNNKADIRTEGTGATIIATGLCTIGTLVCDGQIDVIGTGVMLIDNIELAEGCNFNLHSIKDAYGEDGGSVAVFLRQEDETYLLINGSVTGIIDEDITLPEGTTLVLPENSKLNITGLHEVIKYDEDGNPQYRYSNYNGGGNLDSSFEFDEEAYYIGKLTVDNLVINNGSTIITPDAWVIEGIKIVKSLVNNGIIHGNSVDIQGDYSGSGTIENATITVGKGQEMSIKIEDSTLNLSGSYVIDELTASGSCELYYDEDTTIKRIEASPGDQLDIYTKMELDKTNKLTLAEAVNGGRVFFGSGIINIEQQLLLQNGAKFIHINPEGHFSGAVVFDYSGSDIVSLGVTGPIIMGPKDIQIVPGQKKVPVVCLDFNQYGFNDGHEYVLGVGHKICTEFEPYTVLDPFDTEAAGQDGIITYEEIYNKYSNVKDFGDWGFYVEVIRCVDNRLSVTVLNKYSEVSVPADNIILMRVLNVVRENEPLPGEVITNTITNRTGAATIGGNPNTILKGTGIKSEPSEPEPSEPEPPAPKDNGNPEPANNKDPVKSAEIRPAKSKKAAVRAQAVSTNSVISFVIDTVNLNEGKENAEEALYYVLSAYQNGAALTEISTPEVLFMDYERPEEFRDKQLYTVFAEEDADSEEMLKAYVAEYDEEISQLSFETAQLGEFVITALDFDGEEFSPEFYDELEKTEEAQRLINLKN